MVIAFGHEENDEKKNIKNKNGQGEKKKEYKRGQ